MPNILTTFLELGEATSRNLEFAHRRDVSVSYGEETITENNLLEIRRRHPRLVYLETFTKMKESKIGADWEWHIIGQELTARMRVQAKRVQRNGTLKIKHTVRSHNRQQHDLLLTAAKADKMKPVYCFYCADSHRSIWRQLNSKEIQTGCLLADANIVPTATTNLKQIEDKCIPWHYLFKRADFKRRELDIITGAEPDIIYVSSQKMLASSSNDRENQDSGWEFPSIEDLNGQGHGEFDRTGVDKTNDDDLERLSSAREGLDWREQGSYRTHLETSVPWVSVRRKMWIDVRRV